MTSGTRTRTIVTSSPTPATRSCTKRGGGQAARGEPGNPVPALRHPVYAASGGFHPPPGGRRGGQCRPLRSWAAISHSPTWLRGCAGHSVREVPEGFQHGPGYPDGHRREQTRAVRHARRRRRELWPHHAAAHVPDRWLRCSSCCGRHRQVLHRRPLKAVSGSPLPETALVSTPPVSFRMRKSRLTRRRSYHADQLALQLQTGLFQVEVALDAVHDLVPDASLVA